MFHAPNIGSRHAVAQGKMRMQGFFNTEDTEKEHRERIEEREQGTGNRKEGRENTEKNSQDKQDFYGIGIG